MKVIAAAGPSRVKEEWLRLANRNWYGLCLFHLSWPSILLYNIENSLEFDKILDRQLLLRVSI